MSDLITLKPQTHIRFYYGEDARITGIYPHTMSEESSTSLTCV